MHRSDPPATYSATASAPGTYAESFICIAAPDRRHVARAESATWRTAPKWRSTAF